MTSSYCCVHWQVRNVTDFSMTNKHGNKHLWNVKTSESVPDQHWQASRMLLRMVKFPIHNKYADLPRIGPMLARFQLLSGPLYGPLARYLILRVAHAPGMPGTFSLPPRVSYTHMHHATCDTHVPWCMPGSLTSGLLWSRWQRRHSRNSWRMRNPQLYISCKRHVPYLLCSDCIMPFHLIFMQKFLATICYAQDMWKLVRALPYLVDIKAPSGALKFTE